MARAQYGSGTFKESAPGSGVWYYRYRVDGERKRAVFGSKSAPLTRKQAERAARNFEPSEQTPAVAPSGGRTFAQLLTEWVDYGRTARGKAWAPRTAFDNRQQVATRIVPALGSIPLKQLSARDLEHAYVKWTTEGLADGTVHRLSALISSALSFGLRRGEVSVNVATIAVAPAQPKSSARIPTTDEVRKLLEAAQVFGQDMPAAIAIAALTGARAGEIAALQWRDINLERGTVRIDKAATEVQGKITIKSTKTGEEHIARVEGGNLEVLRSVCKKGPADSYVIDGDKGPIDPGRLSDRFVSVRGLAHVRSVTFHSLRKYFATSLLSAGVPVHTVALLGGWKSTRMVLDVYGGATKSGADQAAAVQLL
jgi:integrase